MLINLRKVTRINPIFYSNKYITIAIVGLNSILKLNWYLEEYMQFLKFDIH